MACLAVVEFGVAKVHSPQTSESRRIENAVVSLLYRRSSHFDIHLHHAGGPNCCHQGVVGRLVKKFGLHFLGELLGASKDSVPFRVITELEVQ